MTDAAGRPPFRIAGLFGVLLAAGLLTAYLNRGHVEQQTILWVQYLPMAEHYLGIGHREVLTYPLWGYPLVLILFRDFTIITIVQVLLATCVMLLLFLRLRSELADNRALVLLFVAAVPWYLLHSVKWPQSFAASFVVLGLLALERAVRQSSIALGSAAGAAFALALYFRSEFLYLPLFVLTLAAAARLTRRFVNLPVRPLVACAAVAWAMLLPWAVHFHRETGRYSLTASQTGIVAFISLGQLPNNPWGAVYQDEYAYAYLKSRGIAAAAQSPVGDRVLFEEYKRRVKAHPAAFAAKVGWNAVMTLLGGFYGGEVLLSAPQGEQLQVLRQRLKSAMFLSSGPERTGVGPIDARVYGAFVYWVTFKMLGAFFVIVAMAGLLLSAARGIRSPLLFLLAACIAYQYLLLLALATEPRYLNGLFLAMVPFFMAAVHEGRVGVRRLSRRFRPGASSTAGDLHLGRSKQPVTNS